MDAFQFWLLEVEAKLKYLIKTLKINKRGKFVFIKFKI